MANCTGRFPIAGRAKLASILKDTNAQPAIWVAWGSGTTSIADTDTGLVHEINRMRGTVTRTDADTYTVTASFDVDEAGTFSEVGLFDASMDGTMLYRGGYSTDSPVGVYDVESLTIAFGDTLSFTLSMNVKATAVSVTTAGKTKATDLLCDVLVV